MRDILDERAWTDPKSFEQIVSRELLSDLIGKSGGVILIRGSIWVIKVTPVAPGEYRIYLKEKVKRRRSLSS